MKPCHLLDAELDDNNRMVVAHGQVHPKKSQVTCGHLEEPVSLEHGRRRTSNGTKRKGGNTTEKHKKKKTLEGSTILTLEPLKGDRERPDWLGYYGRGKPFVPQGDTTPKTLIADLG